MTITTRVGTPVLVTGYVGMQRPPGLPLKPQDVLLRLHLIPTGDVRYAFARTLQMTGGSAELHAAMLRAPIVRLTYAELVDALLGAGVDEGTEARF